MICCGTGDEEGGGRIRGVRDGCVCVFKRPQIFKKRSIEDEEDEEEEEKRIRNRFWCVSSPPAAESDSEEVVELHLEPKTRSLRAVLIGWHSSSPGKRRFYYSIDLFLLFIHGQSHLCLFGKKNKKKQRTRASGVQK